MPKNHEIRLLEEPGEQDYPAAISHLIPPVP